MFPEILYFITIIGVFVLAVLLLKLPVSLSMIAASLAGALVAGQGIPVRHLVEGTFTYYSTIETIAAAMIFMKVYENSGAFEAIVSTLIKRFHKVPFVLMCLFMLVLMFPSMITGSSTAAVLSTGVLITPVLIALGVPNVNAAVLVAMAAILGKVAPPVNIPAMVIGAGSDVPFYGFEGILLFISIPMALFVMFYLGWKYIKKIDYETVKESIDVENGNPYGFKIYIPVLLMLVLIVVCKMLHLIPDPGMPAIFIVCAICALFTGKKTNFLTSARDGIAAVVPIMGVLMGAGMLIQIMMLTGVSGMLVTFVLTLPTALRYIAMAIILPAFGGIASFASANVFGIPFGLAFIGTNEIVIASALSLLCCVGDITPPAALAGSFAARTAGVTSYGRFLKKCIVPAGVMIIWGIVVILLANPIGSLLGI